jgi:LysM repeat protein
MQKRLLLTSFCIIFSAAAFAANRIDSIGVENNNGKQIILHKVEAKETYFSLGRKYSIATKDIISYNNNKPLHIGTMLKIPTNRNFSAASGKPASPAVTRTVITTDNNLIDYKVGPKESLYAIARRFNTTVEDIKLLNKLSGNALRVGQIIKVKQGGTAAIVVETPKPVAASPVITTESDSGSTEAETHVKANKYGLREMAERGVAVWITDQGLDGTKMLALHRTAPVGTIVKVTNPMTERSTFAKVVGKFTENESTKDVIIVVTKAAADLLGALDKRFQVNLVYGVPNE